LLFIGKITIPDIKDGTIDAKKGGTGAFRFPLENADLIA
jgi:hypothetical protein